jgi:hypothetical protein
VVHCIGKFLDIDGPGDLHGKVIGFHGERTALGGPAPLVMPEKNTWAWNEKVKINNDPVAHGELGGQMMQTKNRSGNQQWG